MRWPEPLAADGELPLVLRHECGPGFAHAVYKYVTDFSGRLRDELLRLTDNRHLANFALHVGSVARCLARVHLILTSNRPLKEVDDGVHANLLEFGENDGFLLDLWEPGSVWRQPLSSRIAHVVSPRREKYIRLRSHFWMREKRVTGGGMDFVPFSYTALKQYLLQTLEAAWELQDILNSLVVLSSVGGAHGGRDGA